MNVDLMTPGGTRAPATGSTARGLPANTSDERTSLAPEAHRGAGPSGEPWPPLDRPRGADSGATGQSGSVARGAARTRSSAGFQVRQTCQPSQVRTARPTLRTRHRSRGTRSLDRQGP